MLLLDTPSVLPRKHDGGVDMEALATATKTDLESLYQRSKTAEDQLNKLILPLMDKQQLWRNYLDDISPALTRQLLFTKIVGTPLAGAYRWQSGSTYGFSETGVIETREGDRYFLSMLLSDKVYFLHFAAVFNQPEINYPLSVTEAVRISLRANTKKSRVDLETKSGGFPLK